MKSILVISLLLMPYFPLFAQSPADSIEVRKAMGTVFVQNGKPLKPRQLLALTQADPAAYQEMKAAKSNFDVAYVFSFVGGAMAGWTLGTALGGGQPNWTVAGVGAGLIGVSIPFSAAYSKHARQAVRHYNDSLHPTGMNRIDFRLGMTGTGIGMGLSF